MDIKYELNLLFIGSAFSFFIQFVNKFLWSDWEFIGWMALLITIDTITGTWYAIRMGNFNSNAMKATLSKIVYYGISLIVIHIMSHSTVRGQENSIMAFIMPYIDSTMYAYFMLREVVSIGENMGKLGFNIFPVWVMKRLKDFNENGKYTPYDTTNQNPGSSNTDVSGSSGNISSNP